ncbi:unnamed protein product [Paramecium pentaurelia]|uniref:Uncharacterized protein n=1 Tax=Paramecium pentaurelia TaxID=43138 RepID=A0A8S1T857_9CILI|nr:unnamed protein product [Paramecium pentaurelia]
MNQLYDLMSIIKTSGQRGQELMIDSFVIGYLLGKGNLKNKEELQTFVEQLKEIKNQIDQSLQYTSIRDDFLISNLGNMQFLLKNEKNDDKKQKQLKKNAEKAKGKSKKINLAQTTPINPQLDIKDENELIQNQVEEVEKQQSQANSKKSQGQQPQKPQQGVQTRQQLAQSKSDQQKNEQQKNEKQKNE